MTNSGQEFRHFMQSPFATYTRPPWGQLKHSMRSGQMNASSFQELTQKWPPPEWEYLGQKNTSYSASVHCPCYAQLSPGLMYNLKEDGEMVLLSKVLC